MTGAAPSLFPALLLRAGIAPALGFTVALVARDAVQTLRETLATAMAGSGLTVATPAGALRDLLDDRADLALLAVFAADALLGREPVPTLAFRGPAAVAHGVGGTCQHIVRRHLPLGLARAT